MSRWFDPTSLAREALTLEQQIRYSERARIAGLRVHAGRSIRRDCWRVVVSGQGRSTELFGKGDLAAVIDGAMDDFAVAA